ncbi:MAG: ECF transporter S component [Acutalibacteraceae bacterium]|nr:ECF transporter S component [Acutalibacteraceae bacterium]
MKKTNTQKTKRLAVLGLFTALVCVISFLPVRTLGLEITLSMVPVAVGACLYGPSAGAILGGVFGVVSFIQCFGYSPFGAALLGMNPFYTFMVCVPTRILAGWLAGLAVKAVGKLSKNNIWSMAVGSVLAPVFNTLFFMSTLCAFFYGTEYIQGFASLLGSTNVVTFILLFVGINGLVEIIAGFILALPLAKALSKAIG